jgi:hypothetical protein
VDYGLFRHSFFGTLIPVESRTNGGSQPKAARAPAEGDGDGARLDGGCDGGRDVALDGMRGATLSGGDDEPLVAGDDAA